MLVLLAALLSSASAAKFCCAPDQWEADVELVMVIGTNGTSTYVEGIMRMYFDEGNRIVAYNQTLLVDGNPVQQRVVNDHKNNVMHVIRSDGCQRMSVAPWISGCIPDNATELSTDSRYGLGDNSVKIKGYLTKYLGYEVYISVTADTCAPVAEVFTGSLAAISGQQEYGPSETIESLTFANIKPGITDRTAFFVPTQCGSSTGQAVGRRSFFHI